MPSLRDELVNLLVEAMDESDRLNEDYESDKTWGELAEELADRFIDEHDINTTLRWRERFNAAVEDAQRQRDALFSVRKAWLDSGPEPAYHRMHQDNLRRNWPVLYDAIRKAVYYDGGAI